MNRLGCYILLVFCSIGWWQDISRADQIPILDVINNAGSLELKVVGDSQKSRIEYKSDYGPWAILTSDTGKNDWSFPISNSNQRRLFRVVSRSGQEFSIIVLGRLTSIFLTNLFFLKI